MRRNFAKKAISLLLMAAMLSTMLPVNTFAASGSNTGPTVIFEQESENTYTDVNQTDWFYEAVKYALENEIFSGTGKNTFSPNFSLTRAMYVTVLGRVAGIDVSQYNTSVFNDVAAHEWYAPYVAWAVEKGITDGTGNGNFSPNEAITREQMAKMTVAYFEAYQIPYGAEEQTASEPGDKSSISPWALDFVLKLWRAGLFKGNEKGNFNPRSNATRAEAAAFCMRIHEAVKEWAEKNMMLPPKQPEQSGSGEGGGSSTSYTLTFDTNGGNPITPASLPAGTKLDTLPVPLKLGAMFDGWFYDSACTSKVQDTDVLTRSLTLYAKFTDAGALVQEETLRYASALDQKPDFSIVVLADGKSLEEVKAALTAENLFAPGQTDIIKVTGSGGSFTISAKNGTFDEGASYKLTLTDDALRFSGYADTVRTFTFSIAKQEVMKLGLSDSLKYLPAAEVSNMTKDGSSVSSLSVPLATLGTDISILNYNEGTFTYDGEPGFEVGDVVALYEGVRPDQRNINDDSGDGDVAYVEITAVNGTTYSYKTADAKEVLFIPDILPVNTADDEDNDPDNNSLTIDKVKMFFGDDKYAELGLDATTTADEGDFIGFYTGTFGAGMSSAEFGRIINVSEDGDSNYVITYSIVTQDEMMSSADLHDTETLDGEKLLANTDVAALEARIMAQAMDSGFADRAADYLTALTLQTDGFAELGEKMNLESLCVLSEDGKPLSGSEIGLLGKVKPELSDLDVRASIGYWLPHFNKSGVSCNVTVSFKLTFNVGENAVVIKVSGTFTEEVKIETSLSADIIWKWYFIIPVPVDFVINTGFEFYTYTGIGVDASITTKENPGGMNIGAELEKLIDSADSERNKETKDALIEKYQEMLKTETDWVEIFSQEIFATEGGIDPFHIVAYSIKLEFIVSANVNVSIGCSFSHMAAKGYYYSLSLANKSATSRQADLVEERQEFTFYVLGTIGLRAGIKLTLEVGLFSVKLDSVGISAEAGVYVRLWGYFYYKYTYSASAGKNEKYAGALYVELGIYLEIKFFAQVLDSKYKYETDIYSNEWPLWSAGREDNVMDFSYDASGAPQFTMCGNLRSLKLDDKWFTMKQMNLKTGVDAEALYDDANDFTIEITNDAFTYDASNNKLTVTPSTGVSKLTGEMIITWKDAPLAFTSSSISRRIPLYWDTPVGSVAVVAYDIAPTADTEPSRMFSAINGESFDLPEDLRTPAWWENEYLFGGWYKDAAFTQPQPIPFIMPEGVKSITLYAKWTPNTHFPYYVEHYQEIPIGGMSTLVETETLYGTARTQVNLPEGKTYPGFYLDSWAPTQIFITAERGYYSAGVPNGVARYHYFRNSHTVVYHMLPDGVKDIEIKVRYGSPITQPHYVRPGYDFDGWDKEIPDTMPDQDGLVFTAKWKARTDTPFRVEHYVVKPGSTDDYTFRNSEKKTGATDTTVTAADHRLTLAGLQYDHATVNGQTITEANLNGDGKLVFKLYYKYSSDTADYTVRHVRESVGGSELESEGAVVFEETRNGLIGEETEAAARTYGIYRGFTAGPIAQKSIAYDGSTVVTIRYSRNNYTTTWDATGGSFADESFIKTQSVKYGAPIVRPEPPALEGRVFAGWEGGVDLGSIPILDNAMPGDNLGYYAIWSAPAEGDTITVYFSSDPTEEPEELKVTLGGSYSSLPFPEPTLEGYTFAGWYTQIGDKAITHETSVTIAADHTLYAFWTPDAYKIDYDLGDGGVNDPANPGSYTEQSGVITLKPPTREGYTFVGWYSGWGMAEKVEEDEAIPVGTRGYVRFLAEWEQN